MIKPVPGNWTGPLEAITMRNGEWLNLDNLTNLLLRDSEKRDYEPAAVLDYTGVRRYLSAFWMD